MSTSLKSNIFIFNRSPTAGSLSALDLTSAVSVGQLIADALRMHDDAV